MFDNDDEDDGAMNEEADDGMTMTTMTSIMSGRENNNRGTGQCRANAPLTTMSMTVT
jgi:hypothetical protein